MKIAIAHYSSESDISGVTTWLISFCERLVQVGYQVVVHLHHFGDDPSQGSILPSLHQLGIETHTCSRTGSLESDICRTLGFLNQVQPDLFLPQCLHAHYLAACHAGRQGLPWIFTMHSDDPDYWCVAEVLTPENNGGGSVCVSKFLEHELRRKVSAARPIMIPYGITLPQNHTYFSDQDFRVVYSGRMVKHQKCIHQVVRTLINACKSCHQMEADMIGDGPERDACQRRVRQAGLADRIRFLGRLPPEQVTPLLQRSQAILLMSDFEGLPLALLEAMACGVVPVVRIMASGIPELVHHEHTGLLVPNHPWRAAKALIRLQRDPLLWQRCSSSARSLVASSYRTDHGFGLWLRLFERWLGSPWLPRPQFPLSSSNLSHSLPLHDRRFRKHYSSPSTLRFALHPRRWVLPQLSRKS